MRKKGMKFREDFYKHTQMVTAALLSPHKL